MSAPILLCDGFDVRRIVIGKLNGEESSTVTTEEDDDVVFSGDSLPDEEEEWSGENRYCFYFVKQFAYDDPEIKAKIDEADNEIYQCNTDRIHIVNRLKLKRVSLFGFVGFYIFETVLIIVCEWCRLRDCLWLLQWRI